MPRMSTAAGTCLAPVLLAWGLLLCLPMLGPAAARAAGSGFGSNLLTQEAGEAQ